MSATRTARLPSVAVRRVTSPDSSARVAPGFTADTEFFQGQLTDERRSWLLEATMTKREGTVADIANTIHFLASPGGRHLTGQVLHVNGGALTSR